MKTNLNAHINITKTPTIAFTKKPEKNDTFKRAVAGASAALLLTSAAAPAIGTLGSQSISIRSEYQSKLAILEKMQKVTQRYFEIEAELELLGFQFENNYRKENELLAKLQDLYSQKREAKTDKEKERIDKEITSAEEDWFKNVTEFGALDTKELMLTSQRTWLQEELYSLQGARDGKGTQNDQTPYSERYYLPNEEEVTEAIDQSSKNNLYILFLEDILAECKDNSTISIRQKLAELNQGLISLKPNADTYLSVLEQHRIEISEAVEPITDISRRIREIEANPQEPLDNNQEYLNLKQELKSHQDKRDELTKEWNDFKEANKPAYDEYQTTLLKIIVLESYLNEVYTF